MRMCTHTHTHTLRGAKAEDMGEDLSEEGPVPSCWGTTVRIKSWQYISAPLPHGVLIWRWQDLAQRSLSVSTNQSKSLSCSDEAERVCGAIALKVLLGFLSLQSVDTHGFNVCQLTVCQDGLSVLNAYILHRLCYMCFTG